MLTAEEAAIKIQAKFRGWRVFNRIRNELYSRIFSEIERAENIPLFQNVSHLPPKTKVKKVKHPSERLYSLEKILKKRVVKDKEENMFNNPPKKREFNGVKAKVENNSSKEGKLSIISKISVDNNIEDKQDNCNGLDAHSLVEESKRANQKLLTVSKEEALDTFHLCNQNEEAMALLRETESILRQVDPQELEDNVSIIKKSKKKMIKIGNQKSDVIGKTKNSKRKEAIGLSYFPNVNQRLEALPEVRIQASTKVLYDMNLGRALIEEFAENINQKASKVDSPVSWNNNKLLFDPEKLKKRAQEDMPVIEALTFETNQRLKLANQLLNRLDVVKTPKNFSRKPLILDGDLNVENLAHAFKEGQFSNALSLDQLQDTIEKIALLKQGLMEDDVDQVVSGIRESYEDLFDKFSLTKEEESAVETLASSTNDEYNRVATNILPNPIIKETDRKFEKLVYSPLKPPKRQSDMDYLETLVGHEQTTKLCGDSSDVHNEPFEREHCTDSPPSYNNSQRNSAQSSVSNSRDILSPSSAVEDGNNSDGMPSNPFDAPILSIPDSDMAISPRLFSLKAESTVSTQGLYASLKNASTRSSLQAIDSIASLKPSFQPRIDEKGSVVFSHNNQLQYALDSISSSDIDSVYSSLKCSPNPSHYGMLMLIFFSSFFFQR